MSEMMLVLTFVIQMAILKGTSCTIQQVYPNENIHMHLYQVIRNPTRHILMRQPNYKIPRSLVK